MSREVLNQVFRQVAAPVDPFDQVGLNKPEFPKRTSIYRCERLARCLRGTSSTNGWICGYRLTK